MRSRLDLGGRSSFRRILANARIYPSLPKYDEIEVGHIRKMVRSLLIEDCARKEIETLR